MAAYNGSPVLVEWLELPVSHFGAFKGSMYNFALMLLHYDEPFADLRCRELLELQQPGDSAI